MKTVFMIIALMVLSTGYAQNGALRGRIVEFGETGFPGLTVELARDGNLLYHTQTDLDGGYSFKDIPLGTYSIKLSYVGMREETVENITVKGPDEVADFTYPKPCTNNKKICPKGHKANIIPIVYGLPNKRMMKKAQNNKAKLGGCTPYCEKWHCTAHDLDF